MVSLLRSRAFACVLVIAAVGATTVNLTFEQVPIDWRTVMVFALAAVIVSLFDVWLPRGDSTDMSGALVFAAVLVAGPLAGAFVAAVARTAAMLAHRRRSVLWIAVEDTGRRILLAEAALLLYVSLGAGAGSLGEFYVQVLASALFFFVADAVLVQAGASLRLSTSFAALLVGSVRMLGWMNLAQLSVAALAVLTWDAMGEVGIVIVSSLLLVMRQSLSLLVEIRSAYRATVEVLARALEAHDPERRGHAERVAALATEAGRQLGLHGPRLEALGYAALFHDVGRIGEDESGAGALGSADVLSEVTLISPSLPILRLLDAPTALSDSPPVETIVSAYIIARASEFDDADHGRSIVRRGSIDLGARLYASTRRDVDRVMGRLQRSAGRRGADARPLDGVAW
ncbi:MAG: hypothetical protein Q7W30_05305 [Coriobacteriia bacterium]|nr:hypothetical protein [Coriobacteriia bacterium]